MQALTLIASKMLAKSIAFSAVQGVLLMPWSMIDYHPLPFYDSTSPTHKVPWIRFTLVC